MKIIVQHGGYGCDTGCCGHWVECDQPPRKRGFHFDHAYHDDETPQQFAERLIRETFGDAHVADLDWENCQVVEDCDW